MRALKIAGAAIGAVVVVIALLLVIGIPSGFMTSAIKERVERQTGYRLTIAGAARISLWPSLNVTLNDITLQDPNDSDRRLTAGSVQADVTLSSLWSGKPQVTEIVIAHPVLSVPLHRERLREPNASPKPAASASGDADANAPAIDHVVVTDGAVVFSNLHDRVDNRIEGLSADVRIRGERKIDVSGNGHASGHPLKFEIKATLPEPPMGRQNIATEFNFDAPGLLQEPLAGKAEVRLNGSVVMINGLTGTLGGGAFNGWASVDVASKPLVKLDLDFQRLDLAATAGHAGAEAHPSQTAAPQASQAPPSWSNATIDVMGLNYVDAQAKISAAEINIGDAHFAPAAIDITLGRGVLKCAVTNLGAYGGQANGEIDVDASGAEPAYTLRTDLAGVGALPLLTSLADFDKLEGKLQAKISVRATGTSQRAIMSNLSGSTFVIFQDGAIRGLNVAGMIRSLTSSTLSGWQEGGNQATDLSQLSASFRIDNGRAITTDLNLVGPLVRMTGVGTVDLGTKLMAFRVEPKLVMTTEGQGSTADPVGLGIPVIIDGSWSAPRIYPDMAGVLDNPDAAYAKLKEMGKGLFGGAGGGLAGLGGLGGALNGNGSGNGGGTGSDQIGSKIGETLGNLMQQGFSRGRSIPAPNTASAPASAAAAPPPQNDPPPQAVQDSQPMNDVLRQLFNR
jgi:AsmA protein